jgi:hypothetical protein
VRLGARSVVGIRELSHVSAAIGCRRTAAVCAVVVWGCEPKSRSHSCRIAEWMNRRIGVGGGRRVGGPVAGELRRLCPGAHAGRARIKKSTRRTAHFSWRVRPAGRTHLKVKVLYTLGKEKC